jgi:hypothetical protein
MAYINLDFTVILDPGTRHQQHTVGWIELLGNRSLAFSDFNPCPTSVLGHHQCVISCRKPGSTACGIFHSIASRMHSRTESAGKRTVPRTMSMEPVSLAGAQW